MQQKLSDSSLLSLATMNEFDDVNRDHGVRCDRATERAEARSDSVQSKDAAQSLDREGS